MYLMFWCRTTLRLLSSRLAGRIRVTELRYSHSHLQLLRGPAGFLKDPVYRCLVAFPLDCAPRQISDICSILCIQEAKHYIKEAILSKRSLNAIHNTQVTLYQLLMEERYGHHIERGLLWYLREASPEVVARSPYEVHSLPLSKDC